MKRTILISVMALAVTACGTEEVNSTGGDWEARSALTGEEEPAVVSSPSAAEATNAPPPQDTVEALKSRIGSDFSRVVLSPNLPSGIANREALAPRESSLEEEVSRAHELDESLTKSVSEEFSQTTVMAGIFAAPSTDPGRYNLVAMGHVSPKGGDVTTKSGLKRASLQLMDSIGAHQDEILGTDVVEVGASSRALNQQKASQDRTISRKVFMTRGIGGIPVEGERMVFTYNLSGGIQKVRGQWSQIDYARSRLTSKLSVDEFVDMAVEHLTAEGKATSSKLPIRLGTIYKLESVNGTTKRAVLTGYATVEKAGPGGSSRGDRYYFDL